LQFLSLKLFAKKETKFHPRQWVDCSSPAYNEAMIEFLNPTHGSGWIVQIRPPKQSGEAHKKRI